MNNSTVPFGKKNAAHESAELVLNLNTSYPYPSVHGKDLSSGLVELDLLRGPETQTHSKSSFNLSKIHLG